MKRAAISISVKEVLLGPVFCHGARGSQERGGEELLSNTLFGNTEIAGEQVHTPK